MIVQFICRGNTFRSIIAETYLRSLQIPGLAVYSSGTLGAQDKLGNTPNYHRVLALLERHDIAQFVKPDFGEDIQQGLLDKSDIVVLMNERAHQEAAAKFNLPKDTLVWDVADLGELPHVPETEEERTAALEHAFKEITTEVDELVQAKHLRS
jgi:protein-tyrosine-phosphatase